MCYTYIHKPFCLLACVHWLLPNYWFLCWLSAWENWHFCTRIVVRYTTYHRINWIVNMYKCIAIDSQHFRQAIPHCAQLPTEMNLCFYSAVKNDTLAEAWNENGCQRHTVMTTALLLLLQLLYLLLLWWWVSRWQRPISLALSQLFQMIMKRHSVHTVVNTVAAATTTTTLPLFGKTFK